MKFRFLSSSVFACALLIACFASNAWAVQDQGEVPLKFKTSVVFQFEDAAYLSPKIFDVDRDGLDELVLGTLTGRLFACEFESGKNTVEIGEPKALETTFGAPLKCDNW